MPKSQGPMSSEEQRQALVLLARPGWALRSTAIYNLADGETLPHSRIHPGVAQALKRRGYLAPVAPGRPDDYCVITDAAREALKRRR
jgi:hypothetical protein